jgi:hypothetical protein
MEQMGANCLQMKALEGIYRLGYWRLAENAEPWPDAAPRTS